MTATIGILFNPIIPVYLHNKGAWTIIDAFSASWFLFLAIYPMVRKKDYNHSIVLILCIITLTACGGKRTGTDEVCVWRNGQWATDWMQKYVEYVRNNDNFYTEDSIFYIWQKWGLAYIDDDTIPEMLLLYGCEATGNKVLTIHNGEVSEWNSWRCGVSYIPKSGLINNEDGSMGHYYDRIIKLEDGKFELVYMTNYDECIGCLLDSFYVYYNGRKYYYSDSPQEYERYANDSVKQALYTPIEQSINFNAIDSLYPTAIFEKDWKPTLPDGVKVEDYTIKMFVK